MVTDDDGDRDRWLTVGMALHSTGHAEAGELWHEWSSAQESGKYDPDDQEHVWRSFSAAGTAAGRIGVGTIFRLARAAGWRRRQPSAREDFAEAANVDGEAASGAMPRTHAWNAARFVEEHWLELRYVETLGSWIHFDGRRWRMDRGLCAKRMALASAGRLFKEATAVTRDLRDPDVRWASSSNMANGIRGTIDLAKPRFELAANRLDAAPMLFNVQNGTLDLRTHELRHHDPSDLITKVTPAAYRADARCEHWERFLSEVLPNEELRSFFQRLAGYSLQGGQAEKVFAIVHGPPDGGKSTALNAWARALGASIRSEQAPDDDDSAVVTRYYSESTAMATFSSQRSGGGNRPELAKLMGARLVLVNEIKGEQLESSVMKAWTGGDAVTATPKYGHPLSFYADGTIVLVGNELPQIEFEDDAMWERTVVVPFTTPVPRGERVRNLIDRFDLDAVLAWMLEGHRQYQIVGLDAPSAARVARETHRADSDPLAEFWASCVRVGDVDAATGEPARVSIRGLADRYREWAQSIGLPSREWMEQTSLTRSINKRAERTGEFRKKRSGGWRGWEGIYLIQVGERESEF